MSQNKRKILVVDDSKSSLLLLDDQLQKMGLATILLNDPFKTIETVITEEPALILLDIMMPQIDGYELCTKLKTITEHLRSQLFSSLQRANLPIE
jgi:CheY-like chemotaxis protein